MRFSRFSLFLVLAAALVLSACDSTNTDPPEENEDVPVPTAYAFESRFEDGASSVAYPGQVTRNLLVRDLKIVMDGLAADGATSVTEDELLTRYVEESPAIDIVTPTDLPAAQQQYADIAAGKSLVGKATASYSDQTLVGTDQTADELVREYLGRIAQNSQDTDRLGTPAVYTTDAGVNMSQIVNKVLLGAVVYAQGTAKYLSTDLLESSSNDRSEGAPYSTLEHVWDEAYGYFGAARSLTRSFSDQDLSDGYGVAKDVDGDGAIDFGSEYNFTYATYAAKRDVGASDDPDFTQTIFDALKRGRTAIVNEQPLDEVLEHRDTARQAWEKVVAANVVHYLNAMQSDLEEVTPEQAENASNGELNEHWAEAKAFGWVLQYNPDKAISDTQLQTLHDLLGSAPPYGDDNAADDIDEAKALIQDAYGFSDANMAAW